MERKRRLTKIPFNFKKVGLVLLAIILFFLVMDLNNRLNELSRLSKQQEKAATVISVLQGTLSSLDTQVAYSSSAGAVEDWAYEEGHMARPGENLIIPLVPPGTTPIPEFVPTATPMSIENWQIWLALLSGR